MDEMFEAPVTPYEAGFEGFSEPVSGNMCCVGCCTILLEPNLG